MNVIGNTCVGSYYMRDVLKTGLNNPFSWALVDTKSLIYLIKNYDKINFDNIKIGRLLKDNKFKDKFNELKPVSRRDYYILIDNNVLVNYIHVLHTDGEEYKKHNDIYVNDVKNYLYDMYFRRLARMKKTDPVFLLGSSWTRGVVNESLVDELVKLNSKYKIIMAGKFTYDKKLPSNYIYIKTKLFDRLQIKLAKLVHKALTEHPDTNYIDMVKDKKSNSKIKLDYVTPNLDKIKVKTKLTKVPKKSELPKLPTPILKALKIN